MFSPGRITRTLIVGIAATAVIGFTNVSRASAAEDQAKTAERKQASQPSKAPTISEMMKTDLMECMNKIDTQHKGYVTEAEFMNFMDQVWKASDNNHDGKVDRPEWHGP